MILFSVIPAALTTMVVFVLSLVALFFLVFETGGFKVYIGEGLIMSETEPEYKIYLAKLDWVMGKNSQGEQFVKGVISEDKRVTLYPDEEVLFEISMIPPKGISKDKIDVNVVEYMGGEESLLFVFSKCKDCKFVLKDWMETMKEEGFNYPKFKR